ncbi:hypothetical protein TNCV_1470211 [Trichonephila clavipes]|nr:hypothetical protein TNCV_1470211 [Trichonephila clavipes]
MPPRQKRESTLTTTCLRLRWAGTQITYFTSSTEPLPSLRTSLQHAQNWLGGVVVLSLRLRLQPRLKSVDFHDAENRQRPCHMIMYHVKDPLSACLAWVLAAKLKS